MKQIATRTAVIGSGCAGLNAADWLAALGEDCLLITDGFNRGTSRNTGSDKQTYYKLTLSGGDPDSVREMADTLFAGRCVDGDIALCEAALSTQYFLKLVELGVPFPRNRYGEYIGYKTDHDSLRRATSVGPYTSKQMTECLERAVLAKGVPILDKTQLIKILADSGTVCGLLCLNTAAQDAADRFTLIRCKNVIWATGGPAGMYADSVYPFSQYGATGLALEAGARGKNLTEWQYGLASVAPRVYSTAADGSDEREFLMDFFSDVHDMLSNLFLKGYQWPFDVRKIADGSSIIDILVYLETCKGRKVYLDYRTNPAGGEFSYDDLLPEAREYLTRADTGNVRALWQHAVEEMSRCGAAIRDPAQIRAYGKQVEAQLADFAQTVKAGSRTELAMLYRLRDMLLSQRAYLTAMADYTAHGGKSRGSALYTDLTGGVKPFAQLSDTFTFAFDETESPLIQELWFEDGTCRTAWRAPRPIPEDDDFFENVWRSYRETENVD